MASVQLYAFYLIIHFCTEAIYYSVCPTLSAFYPIIHFCTEAIYYSVCPVIPCTPLYPITHFCTEAIYYSVCPVIPCAPLSRVPRYPVYSVIPCAPLSRVQRYPILPPLLQPHQKQPTRHSLTSQRTDNHQIEHTRCRLEGTVADQLPGQCRQHKRKNKTDQDLYPTNRSSAEWRHDGSIRRLDTRRRNRRRNSRSGHSSTMCWLINLRGDRASRKGTEHLNQNSDQDQCGCKLQRFLRQCRCDQVPVTKPHSRQHAAKCKGRGKEACHGDCSPQVDRCEWTEDHCHHEEQRETGNNGSNPAKQAEEAYH